MRFDAALFDLGGVVLEIDFNRMFARWAECSGEELETIRAWFSFDTFYDRHERGEIQAREYFASLRSSLRIDLSDAQFAEGWTAIYVGEIPGVARLLRSLEDQVPLYAFTNSNATHMHVWANAYADTLTAIGVSLDRILFFDDTRGNVDGARAVGMQAVHVRSIEDIARAVRGSVADH